MSQSGVGELRPGLGACDAVLVESHRFLVEDGGLGGERPVDAIGDQLGEVGMVAGKPAVEADLPPRQ
jgi:hypothetical protein